jgi:YfiR/HmsC-like
VTWDPAVPRTESGRGRRSAAAVLAAAFLLCTSIGRAQDVTEPSLKAAFIYSFAKFTEWPQDALPPTATFTACVLGDTPIRNALERTVKGRLLSGRGISVPQVQLDGKLRSCHLLYLSGITLAQVSVIVAAVKGAPVLTISDVDDFARQGGVAQMFVENGKMRFDLNLEVARQSRLQLSSKLLVLAAHVHDGAKLAGQ